MFLYYFYIFVLRIRDYKLLMIDRTVLDFIMRMEFVELVGWNTFCKGNNKFDICDHMSSYQ